MSETQIIINRIDNELKALKGSTPLNAGALAFPEQTPTQSYTASINTSSQDYVVARLAATFTRTDGQLTTPLVDFAYDLTVSPTYVQYMATQGVTITGNDPNAMVDFFIRGYEAATTENSVTFYIDALNAIAPYAGSSATLTVTVAALSTVEGNLTIERLI